MKKSVFTSLIAILSVIILSSCTKDQNSGGSNISETLMVGLWEVTYYHYYPINDGIEEAPHEHCDIWYPGLYDDDCLRITLEIRKDGTLTAINEYPGGIVFLDNGTWKIIANKYITFDMEGEYGDWWIEGEETLTIEKKSNKELFLSFKEEGYRYDYWVMEYFLKKKN